MFLFFKAPDAKLAPGNWEDGAMILFLYIVLDV
jgi:hypothetical protein